MKKIISSLMILVCLVCTFSINASAGERAEISIRGLATSIHSDYGKAISDKISIAPAKSVTIRLQLYNRDKKKWITKYTVKAKNGRATLKYPDDWQKHLITYWRIYCPETTATRAYKSPKITIACRKKQPLRLSSASAVIMEKNSSLVIYGRSAHEKRPMASTTKLMTALLTLEECSASDIVTIGKEAPDTKFGILDLKTGDKYSVRQLLNALLIPSANDSAVALAEHIGGSAKGFVKMMNRRADELCLSDTHYVTPYGLDKQRHYSSAYDLSIIHSRLLDYDEFLEIEKKSGCTVSNVKRTNIKSFSTTNLIRGSYKNLLSGKTGTTSGAKFCFSGAYKYKGTIYVFTILGAPSDNERWNDCKKIIKYIQKNA